VECKTKVVPVIIGATGTISKIIQNVYVQHSGKARNQGNTENSHISHYTLTSACANVNYQTFRTEIALQVP
jgi:hypothetical protein